MKLVLVAGLNPRVTKNGPNVRLGVGTYRIVSEGQINSQLSLTNNNTIFDVNNGDTIKSDGGTYSLSVKGGTEDYINVFAESINVPVTATTT